jgi:tetratricopeptide (TPR) repeat protein
VADVEAAKEHYRRAVEEDETGEIAPWAALALARVDFIQRTSTRFRDEDLTSENLREAYREIIEQYPGTLAAQEATLYLAQSMFAEEDDEVSARAIAMLEDLLDQYPDTPYAYGIYGAMAGHAAHREDHEARFVNMVRQVECSADPDRELVHLYYQIAYHADARMERPDLALTYYRRIIDEYPHDPRNYQVRNSIRRLESASAIMDASESASQSREGGN